MKKFAIATASLALLASCSSDTELTGKQEIETKANAIGFEVLNRNGIITKAGEGRAKLHESRHYNFGVFAYKNNNSDGQEIMKNYLVGYNGANVTGTGSCVGYFMNNVQTTLNTSKWAYEKLGSADYTYEGTDGYYKKSDTFYMSNVANQYLKYWDKSSQSVEFYAYAPYINGDATATIDYSSKTITIPIEDGYDDESKHEYMFAYNKVEKGEYGHEVQLNFKRISARLNIKFYEDVKGYKVDILNLMENDNSGVAAAPAKAVVGSDNTTTYEYGTLYHKGGAKINFSNTNPSLTVTGNSDETFNRDAKDHIKFAIPTGTLPEEKTDAKASATNYYVIPANNDDTQTETGLTFHVTYKLTSEDTSETIIVRNATVHVKYDYCKWQPNYVYTYIFRITKSSTGSTGSPDIDPSDPSVGEQALYPIIFDDCTVEGWQNATDTETPIN
ncbi:MAG: fimbrillin family protein [Prevotella sp.]|nr:fimbrillin family protein [Prevotella sp.]